MEDFILQTITSGNNIIWGVAGNGGMYRRILLSHKVMLKNDWVRVRDNQTWKEVGVNMEGDMGTLDSYNILWFSN